MNTERQRQLGEVGAACWLRVKKKKGWRKTEMNCLWHLSVRLLILSWVRLFLLDIPDWTHLAPIWLKRGRFCHVLNWACWRKLGRLQTCRWTGFVISWMSDLQKAARTHRQSADRMLKGRLLLLLRFSSATFFPAVALSSLWTFVTVLSPSVTSATSAWKNLWRADCVLWAEAVQDSEGRLGLTGSTGAVTGASSTEDGPLRRPGSEEKPLQLFWLQIKVPGCFPGLQPPAWSPPEHSQHLEKV